MWKLYENEYEKKTSCKWKEKNGKRIRKRKRKREKKKMMMKRFGRTKQERWQKKYALSFSLTVAFTIRIRKAYEKTQKNRKQVRLSSSSRLQRQSLHLGLYLIFYCTYIFTHDLDYFQCNRLISPVFYRFSLFMCVRACLSIAFFRWNIRTHSTTTATSMHIPIWSMIQRTRICMYADAYQTSGNFELVVIHRCCCVA